jgi:hypothetical protein
VRQTKRDIVHFQTRQAMKFLLPVFAKATRKLYFSYFKMMSIRCVGLAFAGQFVANGGGSFYDIDRSKAAPCSCTSIYGLEWVN